MTIAQFLSFMVMPAGALVIAGVLHYVTRREPSPEGKKHPC